MTYIVETAWTVGIMHKINLVQIQEEKETFITRDTPASEHILVYEIKQRPHSRHEQGELLG